ncbi:hypothetical protein PLICRDRAFT_43007 [Plicaturopsis crispa FD-325 SS-3]|nr:hypothetical protein PLICRDRAFT_43007 [Plicaturopsis crispa FD-325 SS-3]
MSKLTTTRALLKDAIRPRRRCPGVLRALSTASSVNETEIAHFSRLSSLWWDEQGDFGLLHKMNPVRMRFIREKLLEISREEKGEDTAPNVLRGLDVLDVGCGGGLLSESLARLGAQTLGIDASESNVAIASLHASADPKLSSLTYRHAPAEALLEEEKRFDVVCSMEVLEHVDNPAAFLASCADLLKPGGHLFISTMARTPLAYALTIFLAEDVLRKVPRGTHTHAKYVNPQELVQFFQTQRPWLRPHTSPARTAAEVRGIVYVPWAGRWELMSRAATAWGAAECNYLFWVRKPL